jgi:hypothetical protein
MKMELFPNVAEAQITENWDKSSILSRTSLSATDSLKMKENPW